MKLNLSGLFLLMSFSAPSFGQFLITQTGIKSQFYVLKSEKAINVEVPYLVSISFVKMDSNYGISVFGRLDEDGPVRDAAEIKKNYPGYTINYVAPQSFQSIRILLGNSIVIQGDPPKNGADFFTAQSSVSDVKGDEILFQGSSAVNVLINVDYKRPSEVVTGQTTIDMNGVCAKLASQTQKNTFGSALNPLSQMINSFELSQEPLREEATNLVISRCFTTPQYTPATDFKSILNRPVGFQSGTGQETIESKKVKYDDVLKNWNYTVDLEKI